MENLKSLNLIHLTIVLHALESVQYHFKVIKFLYRSTVTKSRSATAFLHDQEAFHQKVPSPTAVLNYTRCIIYY